MVERTVDPGGNERKVNYTWNSDQSSPAYGQLESVSHQDGSWQSAQYDSSKRVVVLLSGYLNQGPTTNASLCRKIEYDYTPISAAGDVGAYRPQLPRREIEYLLGREVRRRYFVYKQGEKQEIVCVTAGAAWNDSSNLKTVTKRFASGPYQHELQSVSLPDGTLTLYSYATNSTSLTTTVETGQPNGGGTAITDGTRTVTVQGLAGQMISRSVYDIATSLLITQETYSNYDEQQRPQRVTYLDGTYEETIYGCCGPDSYRERDGTTTTFTYDDLKRKQTETRLGITTLYAYDGSGKLVKVTRVGTNSTAIVTQSLGYDLAGRLAYSTNALNQITKYDYTTNATTGESLKTTTYAWSSPSAATRIERYAKDGSLVQVTGTAVHGVRYDFGVEQEGGVWRKYAKEIKLDASGADTTEWTKTYADMVGRKYKTIMAAASGTPASTSTFNTLGQLIKQVDPDGVATLYQYNARGEREYSCLDTNQNSTIDFGGVDRVTRTLADAASNYGTTVRRARSYVWNQDNVNSSLLTGTSETSADGLISWRTSFGLVSSNRTLYAGSGAVYVTNVAPNGAFTVTARQNGRTMSVTSKDSTGAQLGQTTYTYDAHGREYQLTDARTGTTTYAYDDLDRVISVTSPPPGPGQNVQTTTTYFNDLGQAWRVVQPDGTSVTNEYFLCGELKKTSGSRIYPVSYTYDDQGRMKTMTTWTNFASATGAAITTWNYDAYRGFLTSKRYADNNGPNYSYSTAGRLTRTDWARSGYYAANNYDTLGQVVTRWYPGYGPANLYFVYDRLGRLKTTTRGSEVATRFYHDAGALIGEAYSGGSLSGLAITNTLDSLLRRNLLALNTGSTTLASNSYGYDNAGRLQTVGDGTYSGTYTYLANSPLVDHIDLKQNSTVRMTTTKQYDNLNRLTSITAAPTASAALSYGYQYNDANQRIRVNVGDGSYWLYEYDTLGQVKSGKRYWADNTPVAGQQFEYGFDDIGNRQATKVGGDSAGANLRSATYTPNNLNQYTVRTVPNAVDVVGIASPGATVTVNTTTTYRKGPYYQHAPTVSNGSGPVNLGVTAMAVSGTTTNTTTGNLFVPPAAENYTYDLDGNLLTDGRHTYTWDSENRLTVIEGNSSVPIAARFRSELEYDGQGRRVRKKGYTWSGSAWVLATDTKFLYDGWNVIAELDGSNALVRSYIWGLDLGGSSQGAGGVGGLLAIKPTSANAHFHVYEGNGNVMALVDATTGGTSTYYDYGPFGEGIRSSGTLASTNPYRFSTKYQDNETDFYYYGYRFYNASTGRWLSRDPIEEKGGRNLYGFVDNNPASRIDFLGREMTDINYFLYGKPYPPAPPQGGQTAIYVGGEAHFFAGGGVTRVSCCDENKKSRIFWYTKVCFGGAAGFGGGGGGIVGLSGKNCRGENYAGWFYELGGSVGIWSGGVDIGYTDSGKLSGVNEVGGGAGQSPPGIMFKSTWCYYTLFKSTITACGCGQ